MPEKIEALAVIVAPIFLSIIVFFLISWNSYIRETFKNKAAMIKELGLEVEQLKLSNVRLQSDYEDLHDDIVILREILKEQISVDHDVEKKIEALTDYIKEKLNP